MISLDLNKVSDSRVFFLGALSAATVGTGSLAIMLFEPAKFETWEVAKILLAAIAMTLPGIVLSAFVVFTAMREKLPSDEKARRSITLGCAVSGLSQMTVFLLGFSNGMSLRDYLAWTFCCSGFLAALVFLLARIAHASKVRERKEVRLKRQRNRRRPSLAGQLEKAN